jgi:hypothetical protein
MVTAGLNLVILVLLSLGRKRGSEIDLGHLLRRSNRSAGSPPFPCPHRRRRVFFGYLTFFISYSRTRTYHAIAFHSLAFFFRSSYFSPSVYIAVLEGDHVSRRVWQVGDRWYKFTLFVVLRCLRDLRGDVEAKEEVLH